MAVYLVVCHSVLREWQTNKNKRVRPLSIARHGPAGNAPRDAIDMLLLPLRKAASVVAAPQSFPYLQYFCIVGFSSNYTGYPTAVGF
jgi:hypothetical protein